MKRLRRILLVSDAFYMLAAAVLGPIYALFVKRIGGDLLDASGTFAMYMLTAGIVVFLLGFWEDKSKHQTKFVILGYGIGVIGYTGYLLVNSTLSLFIVQAILGLSAALKDPAYDALFSNAGGKHLALAWGEWEAMDYIVWGAGALIGGLIAQQFGFQVLLWCMFLLSIFSFIISLRLLQMKVREGKS